MHIFPSIISADLLNLKTIIETLNPHVHGYHIDVMDDHFVPNLTWGPAFIVAIRQATNLPLHVHCMVKEAQKWLHRVELHNHDTLFFHYESFDTANNCLNFFINAKKNSSHKLGIVINPTTPVNKIFPLLSLIDNVLIMSVNPGFSGQAFIPTMMEKVGTLINERINKKLVFIISMDGGINQENIAQIAKIGVQEVGIAQAIFGQADIVQACKKLYNLTKQF